MSKFISKKDLNSWLNKIRDNRRLVAPIKVEDLILFKEISQAEDIAADYVNTDLSPKEFLFPPTEVLFSAAKKDGGVELTPAKVERETVIFGMRPCDARGVIALDKPFLEEPADPLYKEHRDKTILVGVACLKACAECFCSSMGGGPDDPTGFDIMLTEVKDGYLVQVLTDKGKALLPDSALSESKEAKPKAADVSKVPAEGVNKKLRQNFDNPYWGRLADRCIHCNMCSYVCPTCYCFDIRDYPNKGKSDRVRSWESCQSAGFTKIAGGHDPRANKGIRMRQRFAHKLLYFPEQFGVSHCIGCGRCVKSCPVNIDIREIIQDVQKLGAKGE
jgi:ferredoxin